MAPESQPIRRVTVLIALATVAAFLFGTTDTLAGFTAASVGNSRNELRGGLPAVSHAYNSTSCAGVLDAASAPAPCPGSLYPASSTSSGSARTDSITNTGTVAAGASYRVAGCGPVSLANSGTSPTYGPMLARNGTTFAPTSGPFAGAGSITLDGTKGYASSTTAVTAPTYPAATNTTQRFGKGIWFKTAAAGVQPLFSLSTGGNDDVAAVTDRLLFLNAAGQIAFMPTSLGNAATSSATFKDGNWHYAHVLIAASRVVLTVSFTVSISVDGVTVATGTSTTLGIMSATTGYWHVGWGETTLNAGLYFSGSLSGFVVDDSGNATAPTSAPTGYVSSEQSWRLNDSGGAYDGSTVSGILTTATAFGSNDACTQVSATWPLVNVSGTTLRALADAGAKSAAFPAPGGTQTSTITLTTALFAPAVLKGLLLYAPIRADYTVGTSSWTISLIWSGAAPAGTVVIA